MSAALLLLAWLWLFWGVYVLVMGLYRAQLSGHLTGVALALSLPFVVLGYALDVATNLLLAPLLFLDWPRELLLTSRLKRYMGTQPPARRWQRTLAWWICDHLLDPFDPSGRHC